MEATLPYACLLIDRHKPGVYSTLHLMDQVWWDWLHQAPPAGWQRSSVAVQLPAGRVTQDGERSWTGTPGSFANDLLHAVAACEHGTAQLRFADRDPWLDEDEVRAAALAACTTAGIDPRHVAQGLWY